MRYLSLGFALISFASQAEAPYFHEAAPEPAAQQTPPSPQRQKKNPWDFAAENYCKDKVMKNATALLYAAGSEAFSGKAMNKHRRNFLQANFLPQLQMKIVGYRHSRPRYFDVEWPLPGLEKKFSVVRYTLDSPSGAFKGQIEDVVKVEPVDPATGKVFKVPPGQDPKSFEICRFNSYRCLHKNGCQWQRGKSTSEAERLTGVPVVKEFADKAAEYMKAFTQVKAEAIAPAVAPERASAATQPTPAPAVTPFTKAEEEAAAAAGN